MEKSRPKLTGQLIKEMRVKMGWSQEMLAERIKDITNIPISKYAISKWERQSPSIVKAEPWNIKALNKLFWGNNSNHFDLFTNLLKQYASIDAKDRITGKYYSIWGFDNEKNPEIIEFKLKEKIIVGKVKKGAIEYELYGYLFTNKILSGFWVNKEDGHHGTVMLEFTFGYKKAIGNWIGTFDRPDKNKTEHFKYGHWSLEKIKSS
ncbi:MAG: helix-turn-helix domain-containing protein [Marinifilaceae bacterium]|nr:helix-turn-helix domain-containing protein [Marinifilaceae bacterium]